MHYGNRVCSSSLLGKCTILCLHCCVTIRTSEGESCMWLSSFILLPHYTTGKILFLYSSWTVLEVVFAGLAHHVNQQQNLSCLDLSHTPLLVL